MKPNRPIDEATLVDLLRLANRLHQSRDGPAQRKRLLLEGLSDTIQADAGLCVVAHLDGSDPPHILSRATNGRHGRGTNHPDQLLLQALLPALAAPVDTASIPPSDPHVLCSTIRLRTRDLVAGVTFARVGRRPAPFAPADQLILQLVHAEMRWIYDLDLPLASPDVRSLSQRPRETLQYLLGGFGEKQIASALGLSPNTVHHYVKHLYRHFNVSSRSELLSRWVKGKD